MKKDLEEKESILGREILQNYPSFIEANDNISEIKKVLKTLKNQLSQYTLSISNLKSKISTLSHSNSTNEWQSFINNSLDKNWDQIESDYSEDVLIAQNMIPEGNYNFYALNINILL